MNKIKVSMLSRQVRYRYNNYLMKAKLFFGLWTYYYVTYKIIVEDVNKNFKEAYGDIALPSLAIFSKINCCAKISEEWVKKGFVVKGVFVTSITKLKNEFYYLCWINGIEKLDQIPENIKPKKVKSTKKKSVK